MQFTGAFPGWAEVLSSLSLFVSIIAAVYARSSIRASTLAAHMSAIVQVESRLAELPDALRFHGLSVEDLKAAGIEPCEFAYLLNSFTLGSIRQRILSRWDRRAFPSGDYRYQMCLAKETRRAWPLVKKLMNPGAFVDRIDRTIEKIEKQEALSLLRPQGERA
jgi:hypothetical protein